MANSFFGFFIYMGIFFRLTGFLRRKKKNSETLFVASARPLPFLLGQSLAFLFPPSSSPPPPKQKKNNVFQPLLSFVFFFLGRERARGLGQQFCFSKKQKGDGRKIPCGYFAKHLEIKKKWISFFFFFIYFSITKNFFKRKKKSKQEEKQQKEFWVSSPSIKHKMGERIFHVFSSTQNGCACGCVNLTSFPVTKPQTASPEKINSFHFAPPPKKTILIYIFSKRRRWCTSTWTKYWNLEKNKNKRMNTKMKQGRGKETKKQKKKNGVILCVLSSSPFLLLCFVHVRFIFLLGGKKKKKNQAFICWEKASTPLHKKKKNSAGKMNFSKITRTFISVTRIIS